MQWGMAPSTKPRHSTAPLGLPGRQITSAESITAARLRERIALGVIFIDSIRITSPKPGNSRNAISRTASGVTSRVATPVPPVVRIRWQPLFTCSRSARWMSRTSSGTTDSATISQP